MQLTRRDVEILKTIYHYDGILSVDQVHRWFFGAKRRAYYRIAALSEAKCIQRLAPAERYRVPEPIVWLDKIGAQVVANHMGVEDADLNWRSQPRWSRVGHDLALNEVRHSLTQAWTKDPQYSVETWHGQEAVGRLLSSPIAYLDPQGQQHQKVVNPDGYCCVRVDASKPYRLRFVIELDNNSFSSRRFGRDKVAPLIHLMRSPLYQQELGGQAGRVLVVTVGSEVRFHHLRSEVKAAGGSGYFVLTRAEWIQPETALTTPIFYVAHLDTPVSFTVYHTDSFQRQLRETLIGVPQLRTLY